MRLATPCLAALLLGAGACLRGQPPASGDSPFLPPPGAAANGAQPASDPYELTGVSTTSRGTQICIFDKQAKRSHWIGVGNAYGDIQAVSYDSASDHAVIEVRGSRMSLGMRKAMVSYQPVFTQAPVATAYQAPVVQRIAGPPLPQKSADTLAKEREARMLVSDLMDIGMQQRKAYEEAQKRQAQQAAKQN